jgi:hypothetical protein
LIERTNVFIKPQAIPGFWDDDDIVVAQQPRQGHLRRRYIGLPSETGKPWMAG